MEPRQEQVREPVRAEPARADYRTSEPAPVIPTFQAPPVVERAPEPVIHVAEERALEPIVDPWVEEFESDRARPAAAAHAQGDLYLGRGQPAPEPEPAYDDRDHRRSGWSLFGSKKPRASQHDYAPPPRQTAPAAPEPQGRPQLDAQDDLEIPSFLRRLAN